MSRPKPPSRSFSRRRPRLKGNPGRPGVPYIPRREPEIEVVEEEPLYAVFAKGHRVYLPGRRPGVPFEEAKRLSAALPGSYVKQVAGPEDPQPKDAA